MSKYKFEVGDEVYSTYFVDSGSCGKVIKISGDFMPYLVESSTGLSAWHDASSLEKVEKEETIETKTNDAGELTGCNIDDTLEERGKRYGTFDKHSELSQKLSGAIRYHRVMNDKQLSDIHTEALNQICHKIARIVNGDPNYDDSWRDIAGYATLVVKHLNGEDV